MTDTKIIAIVEDDASFGRALVRSLQSADFEVQMFTSAEAFLAGPTPEAYGCLILDIQLPGISGFALLDRLLASTPSQSAVFISAQDSEALRQQVSRYPRCSFLRKPFVRSALLEAVQEQFTYCRSAA